MRKSKRTKEITWGDLGRLTVTAIVLTALFVSLQGYIPRLGYVSEPVANAIGLAIWFAVLIVMLELMKR